VRFAPARGDWSQTPPAERAHGLPCAWKESTTLLVTGQTRSSARRRRRRRWQVAIGAALVAVVAIVLLEALEGSGGQRDRPALQMLRGRPAAVEARLRPLVHTIAGRVERIRGLRFHHRPRVVVMNEERLATFGHRLARNELRRARLHPSRLRANRRLERASIQLDQIAGLLPPESGLGPDTTTSGLERVGGAFDFTRDRIIIVPTAIQTRIQLDDTLAHELDHALESQHFNLQLRGLARPGEATSVRRAVIEGSAILVQDRYQQRYLGDDVPVVERMTGLQSLIASNPSPYAVNAQAIFDYVDGALFMRKLYLRRGNWSLVNRALRAPPRQSQQILHPSSWPGGGRVAPIRLGLPDVLRGHWRRVGGGSAGEEQALVILLAGGLSSEAQLGASGWDGGRFAVWAPRGHPQDCAPDCVDERVGVVAFRWRHPQDASQFSLAAPGYANLGLLGDPLSHRVWKLGDRYLVLGRARRASALAFAPTKQLALSLAHRSARSASAYDVRGESRGPSRAPRGK
jgi:hypothetical protein